MKGRKPMPSRGFDYSVCPNCFKTFQQDGWTRPKIYCCRQCKDEFWRKKRSNEYKVEHPRKPSGLQRLSWLLSTGRPCTEEELIQATGLKKKAIQQYIYSMRRTGIDVKQTNTYFIEGPNLIPDIHRRTLDSHQSSLSNPSDNQDIS
jgi:biotin operon repressor